MKVPQVRSARMSPIVAVPRLAPGAHGAAFLSGGVPVVPPATRTAGLRSPGAVRAPRS